LLKAKLLAFDHQFLVEGSSLEDYNLQDFQLHH
jgi:hypothetical protein